MKTNLAIFLFIGCCFIKTVLVEGQEIKSLYVSKIKINTDGNEDQFTKNFSVGLMDGLQKDIEDKLLKTSKFKIFERESAIEQKLLLQFESRKKVQLGPSSERNVDFLKSTESSKLLVEYALKKKIDYFVTINISNFATEKKEEHFPSIDRTKTTVSAYCDCNVQIHEVRSKELIQSSVININESLSNNGSTFSEQELTTFVKKKLVQESANEVLKYLYPAQVVAVANDEVYINVAKGMYLREGMELNVLKKGVEIVDPETGLSLGWTRSNSGLIEVKQIQNKFTICTILENKNIEQGNLVEVKQK